MTPSRLTFNIIEKYEKMIDRYLMITHTDDNLNNNATFFSKIRCINYKLNEISNDIDTILTDMLQIPSNIELTDDEKTIISDVNYSNKVINTMLPIMLVYDLMMAPVGGDPQTIEQPGCRDPQTIEQPGCGDQQTIEQPGCGDQQTIERPGC